MNYKLLVIDVDGTLIDSQGSVSSSDIEAINKAVAKGVKIALSTGRVPRACGQLLKDLNLNGCHIFFDGALVIYPDTNQTIYTQNINREHVTGVVDFVRSSDTYLELYTIDKFFAEKANWTDEIHKEFFGISIDLEDLDYISLNNDILKMETIAKTPIEFEKADLLKQQFRDVLRFSIARSPAFPGVDFINILHPGASKGNALVKLAEHLGIHLDQVVAVGDGLNDISLIKKAGVGIAMGNAFSEVKQVADGITASVGGGGVARVVEKYFL